MTVGIRIFVRYREYPVAKSLQNKYRFDFGFRKMQRVKVSKSGILPTLLADKSFVKFVRSVLLLLLHLLPSNHGKHYFVSKKNH